MGHTPGPWEYVGSTENHGPYVNGPHGGAVCDCYTMSNPGALSVRNGGDSKPIHFFGDQADANARLIAAAPDLLECLKLAMAAGDLHYHRRIAGQNDAYCDLVDRCNAAIAKATTPEKGE